MPSGKPNSRKSRTCLYWEQVFELRRPMSRPEWCRTFEEANDDGLVRIVGLLKVTADHANVTHSRLTVHFYFDDWHEIFSKFYPDDDLTSVREDLANLPSIITRQTVEARGFQYNG